MIICECGHEIGSHFRYGCRAYVQPMCNCGLSDDEVEARYWARCMMKERDAAIRAVNHWVCMRIEMGREADTLQAKLDEAVELLKRIFPDIASMGLRQEAFNFLSKIRGDK